MLFWFLQWVLSSYPRLALNPQSSSLRLRTTSSHHVALIVAILGALLKGAAPGCPHGPSAHLSCVTSLSAGLLPIATACPHSKHLPFWPLLTLLFLAVPLDASLSLKQINQQTWQFPSSKQPTLALCKKLLLRYSLIVFVSSILTIVYSVTNYVYQYDIFTEKTEQLKITALILHTEIY